MAESRYSVTSHASRRGHAFGWVRAAGLAALALLALAPAAWGQVTGIRATKHNLAATTTNSIRATTESEICVFCHTPHGGSTSSGPLWNRSSDGSGYVPYSSPSVQAGTTQPNGYSKLCLSCHDGTIAIGGVLNLRGEGTSISMTGTDGNGTMPAGTTRLGTDLTNDHPVSFSFTQSVKSADGELVDPATLGTGPGRLYPGSNPLVADAVQCTSCHDPHTDQFPKFLRKSPKGQLDNLCMTCHLKTGWAGSTHESSALAWPAGQSIERVRDHSCMACHAPHTDSNAERLLRNGASAGTSAIEQVCFQCHSSAASGGIAQNIQAEFSKTNKHPVTLNPGGHKPVFITRPPAGLPENVLLNPASPAEDPRFTDVAHVECVDCHNPHRVKQSNRTEGMRGISMDGNEVENVVNDPAPTDGQASTRQYPVCFRCHSDTFDKVIGTAPLASGALPSNKRIEFRTTNSAYHPVGGPGRNSSANLNEQLTPNGLSTSSVIKCTDCHNSDVYETTTGRAPTRGTTVSSPVGPHGSRYPSILRANYVRTLPGPSTWSTSNFNLCFRCHDATRLATRRRRSDGARTNFYDVGRDENLHWVHLIDRIDKSRPVCKSCHYNIHSNEQAPNTIYRIDGIDYTTPPPNTPSRMVNFFPTVIRGTSGNAKPVWQFTTSNRQRRCYLQCHSTSGGTGGATMSGYSYGPVTGDMP